MTDEMVLDLAAQIIELGNEMTCCHERCDGIHCDQEKGVLPRGLFFEARDGESGCAVVGLNPAIPDKTDEERFYRERGPSYSATFEWWEQHTREEHPYYKRLADLLSKVGITGPILWTDLIKCQFMRDVKMRFRDLPLSTQQNCIARYLQRELDLLPSTWPIFAAGSKAYDAVRELYFDHTRTVIGVPHPNSHGDFSKLVAQPSLLERIRQIMRERPGQIVRMIGKS